MRHVTLVVFVLAACGLAACGPEPLPSDPSADPSDLPELTDPPVQNAPQTEGALRMDGIGDVAIGESLTDASAVLAEDLAHHDPSEGATCSYAFPETIPGAAFMLDGETIVRIDVMEGGTQTPEGIGIGATEDAVEAAYGPNVVATPHKYVDGQYLTVSDPDSQDASLRYVFETDGDAVTAFRTGRVPQVEWIEGCS